MDLSLKHSIIRGSTILSIVPGGIVDSINMSDLGLINLPISFIADLNESIWISNFLEFPISNLITSKFISTTMISASA